MIPSSPTAERPPNLTLLGKFWPKLENYLGSNIKIMLAGKAECDLEFPEISSPICALTFAGKSIVLSTGLILRISVLAKIVSSDILLYRWDSADMPGIIDGVYYDDFPTDSLRKRITKRKPPLGMRPAFDPDTDSDVLWKWGSAFLDSRVWESGQLQELCEAICSYALLFLICHEVAHLKFDHRSVLKKISTQNAENLINDQKSVELQADFGAASTILNENKIKDPTEELGRYLYLVNISMMIALSFGKNTQRGLRSYDSPIDEPPPIRAYPHPAVRQALLERFFFEKLANYFGYNTAEFKSMYRMVQIAKLKTTSALNFWFLHEVKREAKGDIWGVPHPYNYLPVAFRMTQNAAIDFQNLHFPAYLARYFPNIANPLSPWRG